MSSGRTAATGARVVVGLAVAVVLVRMASSWGLGDTWVTAPVLGAFPLVAAALVVLTTAGAGAVWLRGADRLARPAAVLAVCALVACAVVLPRAVGVAQPDADGPAVVVGVVNVRRGLADPVRVAQLVDDAAVDVLVVIELTDAFSAAFRRTGIDAQLPERALAPTSTTAGGGIWSRYPLEPLRRPDPGGDTPDVGVRLPDGTLLRLTSTHPVPPIGPDLTRRWQQGLGRIRPPPADVPSLVAGDLNATLDHAAFRALLGDGWRDAAREVGAGLQWTYEGFLVGSASVPMALDHVLVSDGIAVDTVTIHGVDGTDHRMVVADLRLPR